MLEIKSFCDKSTERLFRDEVVRKFQGIASKAKRKAGTIHAAAYLKDLNVPPPSRLEKLQWIGNDAHQVSIVDYH
jgi:plasmid maintenance system killer protein